MTKALKKLKTYLNGELRVRYTLKTDDITQGTTPHSMPYRDRKGYFDEDGFCADAQATLRVRAEKGGIHVRLSTRSEELSEFGLSLPVNFMGKKNGGGWQEQYLLNSVYTSKGNRYKYCYLTNPNGKNLMIFPKGGCDGWKCDYSSEFSPGHFFLELEFLANFDRAYQTGSERKQLELYLFEVSSFEEGLEKLCQTLKTCALTFEENTVQIGRKITLTVHGACDKVICGKEVYYPKDGRVEVLAKSYGLTLATPYFGRKKGLDCTFFAYRDMRALYKKSNDAVSDADLARMSGNLCESKCWMSAMIRYMLRYGKRGTRAYRERLNETLKTVLAKDEKDALPRQTIYHLPQENEPAYYIYKSNRIQELLFGVTVLTDMYRLTKKKEYFTYLTGALDAVLQKHFENGMIYTSFLNGEKEDYTTICCLIIPFVDAAVLLEKSHKTLAKKYRKAASQIAEYLYKRQGFHTETIVSEYTEAEMEDGSISCTALSLLYYCAKIERKEEYIQKAKAILDLHEVWVTHTPIAPCYTSSLRWWETFWEGDGTGASICYGHAWTIWRAEADYWYYYLTGDKKYLQKARNGFGSNLSKIGKDGKMFSCYLLDYIPGGGFHRDCKEKVIPIRQGIPALTDSGLTRYVWIRAHETILNEQE